MIAEPGKSVAIAARWLGVDPLGSTLSETVDSGRAEVNLEQYPDEVVAQIRDILAPIRTRLGYPVGTE